MCPTGCRHPRVTFRERKPLETIELFFFWIVFDSFLFFLIRFYFVLCCVRESRETRCNSSWLMDVFFMILLIRFYWVSFVFEYFFVDSFATPKSFKRAACLLPPQSLLHIQFVSIRIVETQVSQWSMKPSWNNHEMLSAAVAVITQKRLENSKPLCLGCLSMSSCVILSFSFFLSLDWLAFH